MVSNTIEPAVIVVVVLKLIFKIVVVPLGEYEQLVKLTVTLLIAPVHPPAKFEKLIAEDTISHIAPAIDKGWLNPILKV